MTRARRSLMPLFAIAAGLVGAPALWFAQMAASETLASTACYPLGVAQLAPRWAHVGVWLALIAGGAFALAAACAAWIAHVWRRPDDPDIRAATRDDSTRFLVRCAMLAALGFVVGLVFTGIVTGFVGPCSPWR
ncbi:cytochrome C oxidase subunit I [Burkholderia multivorans]|uniref:cytochrome C oxidase subunit I n=1 Tax=Burkholderia multivorans TaxID=87883 RepID=UPI001591EC92|nr:cytochrome C oxidase subunit I [Burkholderia multivorans]